MINKFGIAVLGTMVTVAAISIQTPAQAAKLTGTFDWKVQPPKTEVFMGTASFMINKDKKTGQLTFKVSGVPNPNPSPIANPNSSFTFDITSADITEKDKDWKLNSFDFVAPKGVPLEDSSGSLNLVMPNDTKDENATEPYKSFFLQADQERIPLILSNIKTQHVLDTCTPPGPNKRISASQICRIPEPNSTPALLAFVSLSAALTLKRKLLKSEVW